MTLHHPQDDTLAATCAAAVKAEFTTLLTAERNYDAAKAEWQRELYLAQGKPGLSLNYWDKLAKGAEASLLKEKHAAYMAARKAYDDAGEKAERKIITTHVYPPIPIRSFDWQAHYEGEEDEQMDVGHGATEAEAIHDLVENFPRGDDVPDDERCGECDGLRGSCRWCQGECVGDARRGDD